VLDVDRNQAMAYRIAAHGLHRTEADPAELAVFDLGVQDSLRDTALLALGARLPGEITGDVLTEDPRFTLAWTLRGAPHYHRTPELPALAAGLFPLDDADGQARMAWQRRDVQQASMTVPEAVQLTAEAIRETVDRPMSKGAVSEVISGRLPDGLLRWCRGCQATHVHEQLMRLSALPAGVRLVAGVSPATLAPLAHRRNIPAAADAEGASRIVRSYLSLHGPATAAEAAGFIGTNAGTVGRSLWPEDLTEVRVAGRRAFLPAERLAELENPPEPDLVRLLPPWDPFLQARDRLLLVPDKAHHKEVWKVLGNPGALLADGEIAGTWRAKAAGRRLDVIIGALWPLPAPVRSAAEEEAHRVATARGFRDVRTTWA
jgi:hypothetical protein